MPQNSQNTSSFDSSKFNKVPYNFVPLNKDVLIPSWGRQISQDIPFDDGEDGIIRFKIKNISPLFVRNATDKDDLLSANIVDDSGMRHFFIPGSSIKGMIRSVLEIMSFGKMDRYNDDFFAYRIFNTKETDGSRYVEKMKTVHCGWLKRRDNDFDEYLIHDCGTITTSNMTVKTTGDVERIGIDMLPDCKDTYPVMSGGKRLVRTGHMRGKKHEYLFPSQPEEDSSYEIVVEPSVIQKFKSVYKPSRSYFDFINKMLDSGDSLAVFFRKDNEGKVTDIGITRMFRYPYEVRVSDGVKQGCHNENNDSVTDGRDMAECIFGYIGKKDSLRGRVQFGNAFSATTISPMQKVSGVLGEPKASFYPYYLKQNGVCYTTYSSKQFELAGRKRYRIDGNNGPRPLSAGNGNGNVQTHFQPLPAGCTFTCEVKLHNMKAVEIGAILSALTFHDTVRCHHNIGMAKGFGYGKLEISDIELQYLSKGKDDYMKEFEKCMTKFCGMNDRWSASEQMRTLISIASDHEGLSYMELKDYSDAKNNNNFSKLEENDKRQAHSMLTKPEFINLVTAASTQPPTQGPDTSNPSTTPEDPEDADRERLSKGIGASLNKTKKFKDVLGKVGTYKNAMDRQHQEEWSSDDITSIEAALRDVYDNYKAKNDHARKQMEERGSNWWKDLEKYVGDDNCKRIFKAIIPNGNEQNI